MQAGKVGTVAAAALAVGCMRGVQVCTVGRLLTAACHVSWTLAHRLVVLIAFYMCIVCFRIGAGSSAVNAHGSVANGHLPMFRQLLSLLQQAMRCMIDRI